MKKTILAAICIISVTALCACGSQTSSESTSAASQETSSVSAEAAVSSSSSDSASVKTVLADAADRYADLPASSMTWAEYSSDDDTSTYQLVAYMNSSDLTDEVLTKFYFDYFYPAYSIGDEGSVTAYIVFEDITDVPDGTGNYLGVYIEGDVPHADTYVYLNESNGKFSENSNLYCTSDYAYYYAYADDGTMEATVTADSFDDETKEMFVRDLN